MRSLSLLWVLFLVLVALAVLAAPAGSIALGAAYLRTIGFQSHLEYEPEACIVRKTPLRWRPLPRSEGRRAAETS
jgi:hypothetical protein